MVRRKGGSTCWFSGHLSYPRLPGELPGNLSLRLSHECTTRSFYCELPGAHSRERLRHRQAPNDDITENKFFEVSTTEVKPSDGDATADLQLHDGML